MSMTVDQLCARIEKQRDEDVKRNTREHGEILGQLKSMNGTQREHGTRLVSLEVEQQQHHEDLKDAKRERGTLFRMVRSHARLLTYAAGVVGAVTFLIQFVLPRLLGGK